MGHGLRFSTETYGSKRGKTVFNEKLREACVVLTETPKHLRKPLGAYGRMQCRSPVLRLPVAKAPTGSPILLIPLLLLRLLLLLALLASTDAELGMR